MYSHLQKYLSIRFLVKLFLKLWKINVDWFHEFFSSHSESVGGLNMSPKVDVSENENSAKVADVVADDDEEVKVRRVLK